MEKRIGRASAPGKIILSGEHSVVYGYPALVSAISLRCYAEATLLPEPGIEIISKELNVRQVYSPTEVISLKELPMNSTTDNLAYTAFQTLKKIGEDPMKRGISISLRSEIPISAGLGSSAATAVSVVGSILSLFGSKLKLEEISSLAYEGEVLAHGTPSGVDNAAATHGGFLKYEGGKLSKLEIKKEIPIIVCNTLVPRQTKLLVSKVKDRYDSSFEIVHPILETMGKIPQAMIQSILNEDLEGMGLLMDINQGLLDSLGVGHPIINEMVWIAKENGALGVKLTGAGGGGCGIILASDGIAEKRIHDALQHRGLDSFRTKISYEGVIIE